MTIKPTYEELEQQANELEKENRKLKYADEELRRYQFMIESAHDAIFFKDLMSRYVIVNDRTLEAFGLSREDVIGRNDYELLTDRKEAEKNIQDDQMVFKSKKPQEIIKQMTSIGGEKIWFQAIKVPQFGDNGEVVGLVGVARNITTRKRVEEALRRSEEKYRGLFDESIAAVYLFDAQKNFLDSNQAGLDLLGYSSEELLNMSIPDVDADPIVVRPAHDQLLGGERIVNYEHQLKRKDGKIITVLNNSRPIADSDGQVVGMQSTLIDITERKKAEDALRAARDELEQRVKERTIELELKTKRLEEVNTAMKVLLNKRAEDKTKLEDNVLTNVKELIFPYLEKSKVTAR